MSIRYRIEKNITVDDFIDILKRSTLAERRPVDDIETIKAMIDHADIVVVAYENQKIVGVARAITDYNFVCYLSDLAVDADYQKKGIGRVLIEKTKEQVSKNCMFFLLSSPNANSYYPKIGFENNPRAWILKK